jgi:hypothetical protein
LKTALIAIPILVSFLYFKFLYTLLMIVVIYITHSEYYDISNNIMKNFISDYYGNITYKTLISFSMTKYIFMICPLILYFLPSSEVFAAMVICI